MVLLPPDSGEGIGYELGGSTGLKVAQRFIAGGSFLDWSITLTNQSATVIEVGDLAVPMVFAENIPRDRGGIYTRKLLRHSYVSGYGSWIYWSRSNAVGPYLVMTPGEGTKFEYFDNSAKAFTPYIHGSVTSREAIRKAAAFGGGARPWRLPLTILKLAPAGSQDASRTYHFKFQFAPDTGGVRDVLHAEGLFDVNIVPGMALPVDLPALISLRTKVDVKAIEAEHPGATSIEYLGERSADNHVYQVRFSRLGENLLTVRYGEDRWMTLEFFVMEPMETVIQKRAKFLVEKHQHADPTKPWFGAYGDWDPIHKVLRGPENRDGLRPWLVDSSDDAGNARPAFIAAKNVFFPDPAEIASVERYIRYYLWNDLRDDKGGMQMTENEKYPYGLYGTFDNWWGHRASSEEGRDGKDHLWRIYDYPHIIHLYFRMYQIAKFYPKWVGWKNADQYLELAYRTAKAYWEVPMEIEKWSADSVATMNEAFLPELIDALATEGKQDWSDEIRKRWEAKIAAFISDPPNLYGSEFAFDSTGFESTHAFARYALQELPGRKPAVGGESDFDRLSSDQVEKFRKFQMSLNRVDRGWLETTYYQLGSDYRSSMSYLLSYMSHLGGWAVLDDALYFDPSPAQELRLGYASSLSAWALVNSGTAESGYGFWYPGKENDGSAGGGFIPEAWGRGWIGKEMPRGAWYYSAEEDVGYVGALRTHRTILTDDRLFGPVALGGILERSGKISAVVPRDGLRTRFHVVRGDQRLHLMLERDGFAKEKPVVVSDALDELEFTLENRSGSGHEAILDIAGLPAGSYEVSAGGKVVARISGEKAAQKLRLPIEEAGTLHVEIRKSQ